MRLIVLVLSLASAVCAQGGTALFPVVKDGKWGFINPKGEVTIPYRYKYAMPFSGGLAAATDASGKFGFVDEEGKWVLKPKYRWVNRFTDGVCLVDPGLEERGKVFIDRTGKVFLEGIGDMSMEFSDGFVVSAPRHKKQYNIRNVTYFNRKGEAAITIAQISGAESFSEGRAALTRLVKGRASVTYIDRTGKVVIGEGHGLLAGGVFSEGLAYAKSFRHEGCLDPNGKWMFFHKGLVRPFKNGLARVGFKKIGFIDTHGKTVIEPTFGVARDFSDGLAPVKVTAAGLWGFCDRKGKIVIEPRYMGTSLFEFGVARVTFPNKKDWGYIDKNGKLIWKNR